MKSPIAQFKGSQWTCVIAIVGFAQYALLTMIAMFFYPGGTATDPTSVGYDFWQNFFSDLGRTKTYSGADNTISSVLFAIAMVGMPVMTIPYMATIPKTIPRSRISWWPSCIGSIIGIFSSVCYGMIGLTPWDVVPDYHNMFVGLAFGAIFPTTICYTITMFLEKTYPRLFAIIFIPLMFFLIGYMILFLVSSGFDTITSSLLRSVGQKIIVYVQIISFGTQAHGALRFSLFLPPMYQH